MIFLIRVFTLLNCKDCLRHLQVLKDYCNRTPAKLEVIDVDSEANLPLIFKHKIEKIPHTICYDIQGNILHNIAGIKTHDQFEDIVYYGIDPDSQD